MNIIFNIGYMWIDMTMIVLGFYSFTYQCGDDSECLLKHKNSFHIQSNVYYYFAYYFTDLFFRFLFKDSSGENCWYPWNRTDDSPDCGVLKLELITEYETALMNKIDQ